MMLPLLLVATLSAPARAADKPLFLTGGPKAEDALRRFVERDPKLKAKLDAAAAREEALLAKDRDPDLRDAVAEMNGPDQLQRRLVAASPSERKILLEGLPGLLAPAAPACPALSECAEPELSVAVTDASLLPDALRRLVRPWMLLQQARGSKVELSPAEGEGDAALTVALKGLAAEPLTVDVTPLGASGYKVAFERPQELAALYSREREAALKSAR
ncbi:MAG TPA: hypothetical protein VN915_07230 [Elusimicrobiota bacterium]|nr:hypothetical protein [Elusimicrobiota bacterium]